MNIKSYLKSVDKQLTDISPEDRKEILNHLEKKLQEFLKKNQENAVVEKLGNPTKYGKALNRQYKLLKTTNNLRLTFESLNRNKNGKRGFLKDMKFIISADMIMPVPTHELWILGGISLSLILLFIYVLYIWKMWTLVWVLVPAFIANGAALLSMKIKPLQFLAIPVDLGRKWFDKRRIIGDSKTFRGFIFGISSAIGSGIVIFYTSKYFGIDIFSSLNYSLLIGTLMGFGALLGDTVKSFFKRRMGLKEGKNLIFFDQLDFLIGAILISLPLTHFPASFILIMISATFVLHILTNVIAFYSRLKKVPW